MSTVQPRVPLSHIEVDDELLEAARSVIASGWWSMGPRVEEFESAFATFSGVKHAIGVANGTAAIQLALLACEIGPGDEVVLPSLNFVAAGNTITHAGAEPVFCDIRGERDLNLDPDDVVRAISPRTRAILALHYAGFPCDLLALQEIADRHQLLLLEDAAHAPGGRWRGRMCGTIGAVGCFSFFSNKNLPIGEGGMVVTNDDALAGRIRLLRSHGMTRLTWDRHRGHAAAYDVVARGFNFRLDELRAAIGLVQLGRLTEMNAARRLAWSQYRELLDGVDGITVPFVEKDETEPAFHLAVVVLPEGVPRAEVQKMLASRGIQSSVHYPPMHRFQAYADGGENRPLPLTEQISERILSLPLHPYLNADEVELVATALLESVAAVRLPTATA